MVRKRRTQKQERLDRDDNIANLVIGGIIGFVFALIFLPWIWVFMVSGTLLGALLGRIFGDRFIDWVTDEDLWSSDD